jgi:hypothetical protein
MFEGIDTSFLLTEGEVLFFEPKSFLIELD